MLTLTAARQATIDVLCEGLRPAAHQAVAGIVDAMQVGKPFSIAAGRRVLETHDIVVSAEEFMRAMDQHIDDYLEGMKSYFARYPDPESEAMVHLIPMFMVLHPHLTVRAKEGMH